METQNGFVRAEGPEEITPPIANKARSFDSLSAAKALCTQLPVSVAPTPAAAPDEPTSPSSPSLAAAAAALTQVQSTDMLEEAEGAVDCLMQLSSDGTMKPSLLQPAKKRPLADAAGAPVPSTRRKLKMRASPLSQSDDPASCGSASTMAPLPLLSSSNPGQLKLLAAAFKICPKPTDQQLDAIASRVGMEAETLAHWFQSRRVLQEWVAQQPHISSSSVRSMFYGDDERQQPAPPVAMMPRPLAV